MKKRKLFGLTTLLLSLGLTACPGGTDTTDPDEIVGELQWVSTAETHYQVDGRGTRKSAAEPHDLVDYEGDATHVNQPATCSSPGIVYKKCTVCGKVVSNDLKKLDHEFEMIMKEDSATCKVPGTIYRKCKNCSKETQETSTVPLEHHIVFEDTGKAGVSKGACDNGDCEVVQYIFDISKATGWNKADTKMNGTNGTNDKSTWDVNGVLEDGTYDIEVEGKMSYSSHSDRKWYNMAKPSLCINNTKEETATSNPDTTDQSDYRYYFVINSSTTINPTITASWGDLGYSADSPSYGKICTSINISGASSFSLMHGNIGYSMIISNIKLTKVV